MIASAKKERLPEVAAYFQRMSSELPGFSGHVHNVGRLAGGMARKDPTAAFQWAESLPGEDRETAERRVLTIWAQTDPRAVLNYSLTRPGGEKTVLRDVSAALSHCLAENIEMAGDWVQQLPPGAPRDAASARLAWGYAERGEEAAARQWFAQVPEAEHARLGTDIASNLAYQNPARAAQWLSFVPAA